MESGRAEFFWPSFPFSPPLPPTSCLLFLRVGFPLSLSLGYFSMSSEMLLLKPIKRLFMEPLDLHIHHKLCNIPYEKKPCDPIPLHWETCTWKWLLLLLFPVLLVLCTNG